MRLGRAARGRVARAPCGPAGRRLQDRQDREAALRRDRDERVQPGEVGRHAAHVAKARRVLRRDRGGGGVRLQLVPAHRGAHRLDAAGRHQVPFAASGGPERPVSGHAEPAGGNLALGRGHGRGRGGSCEQGDEGGSHGGHDDAHRRASVRSRPRMAGRVALVHDFLLDLRGAERVFAALCDAWPEADVYTSVYDSKGTEGRFAGRHPRTSFLQHAHPTARTFRPLLPLYPHAVESFDLRGYDTVVSSSSAWAHGVLVDPGACTSAIATTRSAAPGRSASRRCAPAIHSCARRCARCSTAGASGTGSRLSALIATWRLAPDGGARATLPRPRGDGPLPASRDRTLSRGPGRRAVHGARGADGTQARRRRGARFQRARPAAAGRR